MNHSKAQIEEARRLAEQAEEQVASQLEMIERMQRSGVPTAVAAEARLKRMTGSINAG